MRRLATTLCVLLCSGTLFAEDVPAPAPEHGEAAQKIMKLVRPAKFVLKDKNRVDSKQVDTVMDALFDAWKRAFNEGKIAVQRREQGDMVESPRGSLEIYHLQLRYSEIFPEGANDLLFPLTWTVMSYAPESSFAGLTVYGKKGEPKGRIAGKRKQWFSGVRGGSQGYSSEVYDIDGRTFGDSTGLWGPTPDGRNVRLGDIKNKLAFDMSDKKSEEDRRLKLEALSRH